MARKSARNRPFEKEICEEFSLGQFPGILALLLLGSFLGSPLGWLEEVLEMALLERKSVRNFRFANFQNPGPSSSSSWAPSWGLPLGRPEKVLEIVFLRRKSVSNFCRANFQGFWLFSSCAKKGGSNGDFH